ncbi:MAG: hypothetical protein A2Z25_09885 [Planctomycetes bacterium RBG_16_55_9]|nr:MAG: hypothetical protein A2Z25_09885 [Planctomycetes bacterium RBG_16_55_9]
MKNKANPSKRLAGQVYSLWWSWIHSRLAVGGLQNKPNPPRCGMAPGGAFQESVYAKTHLFMTMFLHLFTSFYLFVEDKTCF